MLELDQLEKILNQELKSSGMTDMGPNGIQIEGKKNLHKIATAVTASQKVIEEAILQKVDALIVHHGLLWYKNFPRITRSLKAKLALLLKHNISLLAYHLPLDAHPALGNNWKAALDLALHDLQPFGPSVGYTLIGVKGKLPPTPIEKWIQQVEAYYGSPVTCALGGKKNIESVGIISGGAHREISHALEENLDCYITGSFDEPIWHLAHEEKINFLSVGHAHSEKIGPKALAEWIEKILQIPTLFIDEENPF